MVRHRTLTPEYTGSIPVTPSIYIGVVQLVEQQSPKL